MGYHEKALVCNPDANFCRLSYWEQRVSGVNKKDVNLRKNLAGQQRI